MNYLIFVTMHTCVGYITSFGLTEL